MIDKIKNLIIFFLAFLMLACNAKNDSLNVLNEVNDGLLRSTQNIDLQNKYLHRALKERLYERDYAEKAKLWYPKVELITTYSDELNSYIDMLKNKVIEESGKFIRNGKQEFNQLNKNGVAHIFQYDGKGKELWVKLQKCKRDLLNIDTLLKETFEKTSIICEWANDPHGLFL